MLQRRFLGTTRVSVMPGPAPRKNRSWSGFAVGTAGRLDVVRIRLASLRIRAGSLRSREGLACLLVLVFLLTLAMIATVPGSSRPTFQLLLSSNAVLLGYLSSLWGLWINAADRPIGLFYSARRIALAERVRLLLSIAPTALGGLALLLAMAVSTDLGLLLLILGFGLLIGLEWRGLYRGMPAAEYLSLRWGISIFAVIVLIDVLAANRWSFRIFF